MSTRKELRRISIDDVEDAANLNPLLTRLHLYAFEMGEFSVEFLKQRINGSTIPVRIVLPVRMTSREICRRIWGIRCHRLGL